VGGRDGGEKEKITSIGEDMKKLGHLCIASGKADWCSHCGKPYGDYSKY
jgi:uncharacterized protein (UPF0179 family)